MAACVKGQDPYIKATNAQVTEGEPCYVNETYALYQTQHFSLTVAR